MIIGRLVAAGVALAAAIPPGFAALLIRIVLWRADGASKSRRTDAIGSPNPLKCRDGGPIGV